MGCYFPQIELFSDNKLSLIVRFFSSAEHRASAQLSVQLSNTVSFFFIRDTLNRCGLNGRPIRPAWKRKGDLFSASA